MEINCKCNFCDWQGHNDDLTLVEFDTTNENEMPTATETKEGVVTRLHKKPETVDFLKGCPNCLTDAYLMDVE